MQFRALLLPKSGEKGEQVFCASLEEAKKWGRKILWDRHRKVVQNAAKGEGQKTSGPRVRVTRTQELEVDVIWPCDVTDADKKEDAEG